MNCEFFVMQMLYVGVFILVEDARGDHMEGDIRKEPARWGSLL